MGLPFGDNEFEIVDADEYIDTILYGNNEERDNKTFKKLCREQKMVLKAIVQDWLTRIGMAWGSQKQAALWSIVSPFLILFLGTNTLQKWQAVGIGFQQSFNLQDFSHLSDGIGILRMSFA